MSHLIDELDAACRMFVDIFTIGETDPDAVPLLHSRSIHDIERGMIKVERYVLQRGTVISSFGTNSRICPSSKINEPYARYTALRDLIYGIIDRIYRGLRFEEKVDPSAAGSGAKLLLVSEELVETKRKLADTEKTLANILAACRPPVAEAIGQKAIA